MSDFLHWEEDICLDEILGDYTDYDNLCPDSDEDFVQSVAPTTIKGTSIYVCPVCKKKLRTISGFRGHTTKQHNIHSLKASDHRQSTDANPHSVPSSQTPSFLQDDVFPSIFHRALQSSVSIIVDDPIYMNTDFRYLTERATSREVEQILRAVTHKLFLQVGVSVSSALERETLFQHIHRMRCDKSTMTEIQEAFASESTLTNRTVNNFLQILLMELIGQILSECYQQEVKQATDVKESMSQNDRQILYYIAGYITPDEATKQRIYATIYGQCSGDAIGLLTEFLDKREAKLYYKSVADSLEYSHKAIVNDMHRMRWAEGDWTDDSDQMILILQTTVEGEGKKEIDYKYLAKKLQYWSRAGFSELGDYAGMGIGKTTFTVLNNPNYKEDPHAAAYLVWDSSQRNVAPNGAVMRTCFVGIHYYWDLEAVKENAVNCAKITHCDPRCQASTIAVSTAVALMLRRDPAYLDKKGNYNIKKIIDAAYNAASQCLETKEGKKELRKFLDCTKIKDLHLDEQGKIGYTYKSMGTGFWALKQDDFRKAITKIVMQGGDADSNACVGGAMLGCKLGLDAIPESWKSKLKHKAWLDKQIESYFTIMGWSSDSKD